MAVGPFSITAEREAVVDYTQAIMEDGAGIIMSKPSPHADDMVRIFLPFHNHVWFSICSFVLLAGKWRFSRFDVLWIFKSEQNIRVGVLKLQSVHQVCSYSW